MATGVSTFWSSCHSSEAKYQPFEPILVFSGHSPSRQGGKVNAWSAAEGAIQNILMQFSAHKVFSETNPPHF